jgi:hypothetical protein
MTIILNGTTGITTPHIDSTGGLDAADLTGALPAIDGSALTGVNSFKPVAVTGTTPSLDVGTYNFFSQGTLTANTTVSFSSVPTEARWSYSFDVGSSRVNDLFDVSTASFLQTFSVGTQDTSPLGVFFKPDGLKMYVLGNANDSVYEYDLSTAWDVSTAVFLQSFSVTTQETVPYDLFFKPDGTKMYVAGLTGDDVNEYDLSTAWDISTASYLQLFSVSAQDTSPYAISFKPDGLKMYVSGGAGDSVYEYNLSTAWNVTTASYLQAFSVSAQDTVPRDLHFKPDGTKMYVAGGVNARVYEYDLSTAWDVSTASYLQNFLPATNAPSLYAVTFSTDGSIMYLLDNTSDSVVQYDVGTGPVVTLPASVENPPTVSGAVGETVTYDFYTLDGGTTVTLIKDSEVTVDVGAAIAKLAVGSVGTYIFANRSAYPQTYIAATNFGTTISGDRLIPANAKAAVTGQSRQSGTWRQMGWADYGSAETSPFEQSTTLFVRIA